MAYKLGNRMQNTFLPPIVDDYVSPEDPVRVYDAFVEALDFQTLGIPIQAYKAGADEYYPKEMLKLIIYGYSYGIRSSRKLERACYHNLSFIWLMADLKPDYRTIARFRSDHKEAIKRVLKQVVRLCIKLDLIEGNTLFIDGSNFRANASLDNTWTKQKCKQYLKKLEKHIDSLVDETEELDQQQENQDSLVKLKKEYQDQEKLRKRIQDIASSLKQTKKTSLNTTDPDCVKAKGRQGTHASYRAQLVVDEKHGLIINSEAVSQNNDLNQFKAQVNQATEVTGYNPKVVCSDSGYFSIQDLKELPEDVTAVMPSKKQAQKENNRYPLKLFDKEQFQYDATKDGYICPQGKPLKYIGIAFSDSRKRAYKANGQDCRLCPHFGVCTKSSVGRKLIRQEYEEFREQLAKTYQGQQGQQIYKLRKQKVELPFAHMKQNLQAGQFMLRGRLGVDAELSVLSTCFNIARMITLIGIPTLILKLNGT